MKNLIFVFLSVFAFSLTAQDVQVIDGIPKDLEDEKLILLKFDSIRPYSDATNRSQNKYVIRRQKNHNRVIQEANRELVVAAMKYPYRYAISRYDSYLPLKNAGYKYVLSSSVYTNEHLEGQPDEGIIIKFEYFIIDLKNDVAYKVFEMDEMDVYDSKLLIKRLKKSLSL